MTTNPISHVGYRYLSVSANEVSDTEGSTSLWSISPNSLSERSSTAQVAVVQVVRRVPSATSRIRHAPSFIKLKAAPVSAFMVVKI